MRTLLHPEHKEREYGREAPEKELEHFETGAPPLTAPQRTAAFLKLVLMDRFGPGGRPGKYRYIDPSAEMRAFRTQLSAELTTGDSVVSLAGLLRGWSGTSSDLRTGYVAYRSADAAPLDDEGRRARAESALLALRRKYLALVVAGDAEGSYRIFWKRGASEKPRPVCTHLVDGGGIREEELSYGQAAELVQGALARAESAAATYPNFSSGGAIIVGSPQTWRKFLDAKPAWLLGETVVSTGDCWVKPGLDVLDERARNKTPLLQWAARTAEALAPALAPRDAEASGLEGIQEDIYYVLVDASPAWRTDLAMLKILTLDDVKTEVRARLTSVKQQAERTGNALRAYLGKKAATQTYVAALEERPAPPPPRLGGSTGAEAELEGLGEGRRVRQRQLEQLVANAIATAEKGGRPNKGQTVQYLKELMSSRGEDESAAEAIYDQMIQHAAPAPARLAEVATLIREVVEQGDSDGSRKRRAIEILETLVGGREPARHYADLLEDARKNRYPVTAAAVARANTSAGRSAARRSEPDYAQDSMLEDAAEILALRDDT